MLFGDAQKQLTAMAGNQAALSKRATGRPASELTLMAKS